MEGEHEFGPTEHKAQVGKPFQRVHALPWDRSGGSESSVQLRFFKAVVPGEKDSVLGGREKQEHVLGVRDLRQ